MNDPAYRARFGLESVPQRMIDMHGPLQALERESAPNISTWSSPPRRCRRADWVRAKAYWWMTDLLHFDRVMQIPFVVAQRGGGFAIAS